MESLDRYKEKFPFADEKTIKLLFLRHRLLFNNKLFKKEYDAFKKLEGKGNPSDFENAKKIFQYRWAFCPVQNLCTLHSVGKPAELDSVSMSDIPRLRITIDLRYSKRQIKSSFKKILDEYHGAIDEYEIPHRHITETKGNLPSDWSDFERKLRIYELKKSMSWKEIAEIEIIEISTARNWRTSAIQMIQTGVPTLKKFPSI